MLRINVKKEIVMGRPHRECGPNLTYHVFSRCIDSGNMLRGVIFKNLLIKTIKMAQQKYHFRLITYSILDNHIHLIIQTVNDGESISVIMQYIKGLFARYYNKSIGRTGPLWNERFGATIIEKSDNPPFYFFWVIWYIAYNPVRKKMVQDPREYCFSGIRAYIEEDFIDELRIDHHIYFKLLGKTFSERVKRFLIFEELYRKRLFYILA